MQHVTSSSQVSSYCLQTSPPGQERQLPVCVMMQSAESILTSKADADLYISLCEEGNLSLSAFGAPHHILLCARVVHVTGTEFGGVDSSIAPINAPFRVHLDAVVCLQQHQNAFHITEAP